MAFSRVSRRAFLQTTAAGAFATSLGASSPPKRIALIGTTVFRLSHAQHFIDRLLVGYGWNGAWHRPKVQLTSLYIDQFSRRDLAHDTAKRHNVPIYPSIAESLTLGGSKLAVDGVIIIGEHGDYPVNEKGQTLYPRYKFFKEVVDVFKSSDRSVPVFNDKHLSTNWDECVEMVDEAKKLGFAFLAGSSLPVTWRLPALEIPLNTPLSESVAVGYGGVDSYDFHGLETAQCMSERRQGGEVGIRSVHALRDDALWKHLEGFETTQRLLISALSRSNHLPVKNGYPTDPVTIEWVRRVFPKAYGYFIEHLDGFRTTLFMVPIRDFNYAGLNAKTGEIHSCQMYLPMPDSAATTANFFNPLLYQIERMVLENKAPYPVERTLLTSGMTLAAVDSIHQGNKKVETPQMKVRYQAPAESFFART